MDPSRPLVRQAVLCVVATLSAVGAVAARPANPRPSAVAPAAAPPKAPLPTLVVPSVVGEAFVFAKGDLGDAGFAWRVAGSVRGFAANTVVAQSPAAGTKVQDTGAPEITVRLKRNGAYAERGNPQDTSPYAATRVALAH
jgi:hypothetical protein